MNVAIKNQTVRIVGTVNRELVDKLMKVGPRFNQTHLLTDALAALAKTELNGKPKKAGAK